MATLGGSIGAQAGIVAGSLLFSLGAFGFVVQRRPGAGLWALAAMLQGIVVLLVDLGRSAAIASLTGRAFVLLAVGALDLTVAAYMLRACARDRTAQTPDRRQGAGR